MKNKTYIYLFISVLILSIFGLIMIYSSSYIWAEYKFNDAYKYVKQQGLFLIVGTILMYYISKIDYHIYEKKAMKIFGICIVLLILVLIPGIGSIRNGSRSWFGIGSFGIQPSEFAKLSLIILTSRYLSKSNKFLKDIKNGVFPILFILLFVFGLIMLQPDFGTGMIIVVSIIAILYIAGVNMKFFIGLGIIGVIGIIVLIAIAPYRMDRITSFVNPWKDPLGSGFQIIQSLYAISPGGLIGRGVDGSFQKFFYLPEPQTDFIFAIYAEEFGFIGSLLLILLYIYLLNQCFKSAMQSSNEFASFLKIGFTSLIAVQVFINLGVVVGLLPVTGITLPFMSYGGSSLTLLMFSMGLIMNTSLEEIT